VIRADLLWLRLRLLPGDDEAAVQGVHRELAQRIERARHSVDKAFARAPEQPEVVRARIDMFRLMGQPDKARSWIQPISDAASQPENAYVLAMLDLAEHSPGLDGIIDRLSTAASGERQLGRARAALIYALARSGDTARAQSELSKLRSLNSHHPLLPELERFIGRHASADAGASADATARPRERAEAAPEPAAAAGDFRARLMQADRALGQGQLNQAEELYESVLAAQPNNTEALAGLADILRRRKDPRAADLYGRVLEQNPSYVPALIAQADQKWDAGQRSEAVTLYRRVLERAGAGSSYGQRAAARLAEAERASTPERTTPPAPRAAPAEPAPDEPEPEETPHIDTTDLPEFNQ
jgi:tetratricopeptide (TPR) repeat protein